MSFTHVPLRAPMALLMLAGAGLLAALACTAPAAAPPVATAAVSAGTSAATATAAAKAASPLADRQVIRVALTDVGDALDPNIAPVPRTYFNRAIFERAVAVQGRELQPMLASGWRVINPTTWEFTVRDARWANGDTVTADDIVFSHSLGQRPDTVYRTTFTRVFNVVDRMEVVDAKTFRVVSKQPEAIIPNRMSLTQIFSRKVYEAAGTPQKFAETPVGSGPYRVKEFLPKRSITLERNPGYVGPMTPTLAEITFVAIPEAAGRLAALQTGDVDVMEGLPIDELDRIKTFGAKPALGVMDIVNAVNFDTSKAPELKSRDVRQALNLAVDRASMVTNLKKGLVPEANQPVLSTTFGYNPELPKFAYNPARAKEMIAAAGFPNGFTIPLEYNTGFTGYAETALAVSADLRKIGITAEVRPIDSGRFFQLLAARQLGPWRIGGFQSQVIADPELTNQLSPGLPGSDGSYSNPEFDRLYTQQLGEFDRAKREALLKQAMKVLHDDPPAIFLFGFESAWGTSGKIDGFSLASDGFMGWGKVRLLR